MFKIDKQEIINIFFIMEQHLLFLTNKIYVQKCSIGSSNRTLQMNIKLLNKTHIRVNSYTTQIYNI